MKATKATAFINLLNHDYLVNISRGDDQQRAKPNMKKIEETLESASAEVSMKEPHQTEHVDSILNAHKDTDAFANGAEG